MPSTALLDWQNGARDAFDEIEHAHRAVGGSAPGRRTLTQEINYSYVSLLAARFQGFARALHSEAAAQVSGLAGTPTLQVLLQTLLTLDRQLDRGTANPKRLAADFGRFGFDLWQELESRDRRNTTRKERLAQLIEWRNAIQHYDIEAKRAAGKLHPGRVRLNVCQSWRRIWTRSRPRSTP